MIEAHLYRVYSTDKSIPSGSMGIQKFQALPRIGETVVVADVAPIPKNRFYVVEEVSHYENGLIDIFLKIVEPPKKYDLLLDHR